MCCKTGFADTGSNTGLAEDIAEDLDHQMVGAVQPLGSQGGVAMRIESSPGVGQGQQKAAAFQVGSSHRRVLEHFGFQSHPVGGTSRRIPKVRKVLHQKKNHN